MDMKFCSRSLDVNNCPSFLSSSAWSLRLIYFKHYFVLCTFLMEKHGKFKILHKNIIFI